MNIIELAATALRQLEHARDNLEDREINYAVQHVTNAQQLIARILATLRHPVETLPNGWDALITGGSK